MSQLPPDDFSSDFDLDDERPRRPRTLLAVLLACGFVVFLAGGIWSGFVFLHNWQALTSRRDVAEDEEPPRSSVVQVPGLGPVTLPDLPRAAMPPAYGPPQDGPAEGGPRLPSLPGWEGRDRVNVLLLGIDHRDDEPMDGSRSDTMLIVSVDPASKSVVMVSLPRDLWVSIPGHGEQRINVAHSLGGPDLAMRTVTANFGVRVTHYARINFRGFEQIIDTLGGIPVDVERPIKDDEYPTGDYGLMRVYVAPGPQWMNGQNALVYARSRHSENDFGRARRQQRVLMAMRERAIQANMIFKAPELVPLAQKTVSTDFGAFDLIKLAKLSGEIDRERVASLVIDTAYASPFITPDGAEVLIPNRAAVQGAINQAFARAASAAPAQPPAALVAATAPPQPTAAPTEPPRAATPAETRVEVLNGTSRGGIAIQTADWLRQRGFQVVGVGNADRADYPESRLLAQPGFEPTAGALATALGLSGAVQAAPAASGAPDVRIILGQGYQLPAR